LASSTATGRLSQLLEHRALPADTVLDLALEIAEGLAQLHRLGRAHGAVTPENVILEDGIARLAAPHSRLPSASAVNDVRQYAALVQELIAASDGRQTEGTAEVRALLEPIIRGYLQPDPQRAICQMKKAVIALKLLRVTAPRPATAAIESSPALGPVPVMSLAATMAPAVNVSPLVHERRPERPRRRVILLVRRVGRPAMEPAPRRSIGDGFRRALSAIGLAAPPLQPATGRRFTQ
jgi:hypothetical protein